MSIAGRARYGTDSPRIWGVSNPVPCNISMLKHGPDRANFFFGRTSDLEFFSSPGLTFHPNTATPMYN